MKYIHTDIVPDTTTEKDEILKLFFEDQLKEIYFAERLLYTVLSKMQNMAESQILIGIFSKINYILSKQVSRLDEVFAILGLKIDFRKNPEIEDLINKVDAIVKNTEGDNVARDQGLILVARKIEHYKMSTYSALYQVAYVMDFKRAAALLERSYNESIGIDSILIDLTEDDQRGLNNL